MALRKKTGTPKPKRKTRITDKPTRKTPKRDRSKANGKADEPYIRKFKRGPKPTPKPRPHHRAK
jgi:hypothetical protein